LPSDDLILIKIVKFFLFRRACHSLVISLRRGQAYNVTLLMHYVNHHSTMAEQRNPLILVLCNLNEQSHFGKLFIYNDEYQYPLNSCLGHNLFAEL